MVASGNKVLFPCVNAGTCTCDGTVSVPMATVETDETGATIFIDKCPMGGISADFLVLIGQALTFIQYNLPPIAGGQDDQPLWFFEVVSIVSAYMNRRRPSAT